MSTGVHTPNAVTVDPIRTLMVGVDIEDLARELKEKLLERANLSIEWHWTDNTEKAIPPACEFVLIITDFCSHPMSEDTPPMAKAAGVPFVRCLSKWSIARPHIERELAKVLAIRASQSRLVDGKRTAALSSVGLAQGVPAPTFKDIAKIVGTTDEYLVNCAVTRLIDQGRIPPKDVPLQWATLHQWIPLIEFAVIEQIEASGVSSEVVEPAFRPFIEASEAAPITQEMPMVQPTAPTLPALSSVTPSPEHELMVTGRNAKLQIGVLIKEIQALMGGMGIREIHITPSSAKAEVVRVETVDL